MLENYNINDYLKDDKELQKAVIQELLEDFQCAVMNVENLLETKQRLKAELTDLKAENERLKKDIKEIKKYQYEQEYLDIQFEEMQKALKTLAEGLNKRQMTLQEVKAIAETGMHCEGMGCDFMPKILDLITKAEEE